MSLCPYFFPLQLIQHETAGNKDIDMDSILDRFSGDESKDDSLVFDVPLTTLTIKEIQLRQVPLHLALLDSFL